MQQIEMQPFQMAKPAGDGTKNKGGRPRIANKKDKVITVKCTAQDKLTIMGKARTSGITASEFLLKLGKNEKVEPSQRVIPRGVQQHLAVFSHAASNLNQIAMRLNKGDELTNYLREQLLFHFEDLKKTHASIKDYYR